MQRVSEAGGRGEGVERRRVRDEVGVGGVGRDGEGRGRVGRGFLWWAGEETVGCGEWVGWV